jgi:hypothetical protein
VRIGTRGRVSCFNQKLVRGRATKKDRRHTCYYMRVCVYAYYAAQCTRSGADPLPPMSLDVKQSRLEFISLCLSVDAAPNQNVNSQSCSRIEYETRMYMYCVIL